MIGAAVALILSGAAAASDTCPQETIEIREFDGVYVDIFEGQRFFESARSIGGLDFRAKPNVWFAPEIVTVGPAFGIELRKPNEAYRIRFVGALRYRTAPGPRDAFCGYGHMNGSQAQIDLQRVIAIEPLGSIT